MTLRYQPLGPECTSTFIDIKANPMVRGGRGGNLGPLHLSPLHRAPREHVCPLLQSCVHAAPVRHLRLQLVPMPRLLACTQRLCPCLVHSMRAAPRGCGGSRLFPGPRLGPGHLRHGAAGQAHLGQGGRGRCGHRLVWTQVGVDTAHLGQGGRGWCGHSASWAGRQRLVWTQVGVDTAHLGQGGRGWCGHRLVWPQVGVDTAHLGRGWVWILGLLPVLGHACE